MIFRSKHRRNFLLIDNAAIRDPRLSLKATGLLALLLSYPDDTRFSREGVRKMKPDGVRGIRAALIELGQAGYLVHEYKQDKRGRWSTSTFVYETPKASGAQFLHRLEARADESTNGARRADSPEAETDARRAGTVIQNWRVTDGAKRATIKKKTDKEESDAALAPQGPASLKMVAAPPPAHVHASHARDIIETMLPPEEKADPAGFQELVPPEDQPAAAAMFQAL